MKQCSHGSRPLLAPGQYVTVPQATWHPAWQGPQGIISQRCWCHWWEFRDGATSASAHLVWRVSASLVWDTSLHQDSLRRDTNRCFSIFALTLPIPTLKRAFFISSSSPLLKLQVLDFFCVFLLRSLGKTTITVCPSILFLV